MGNKMGPFLEWFTVRFSLSHNQDLHPAGCLLFGRLVPVSISTTNLAISIISLTSLYLVIYGYYVTLWNAVNSLANSQQREWAWVILWHIIIRWRCNAVSFRYSGQIYFLILQKYCKKKNLHHPPTRPLH